MNDQKRFLIIAPSWIGDLLMSQSVFKSLKNKYYNCTIDVIAKPYLNDLIKLMPEVNNVYNLDIQHRELGLIKRYKIDLNGKKCLVIGRSQIVGRPISILLSQSKEFCNATVNTNPNGTTTKL